MTGAELDTRRRKLGLSIEDVAELADVGVRTVNRWTNDVQPVQIRVVEKLDRLEATMRGQVEFAVRQVTEMVAAGPLPIIRYSTRHAYIASDDKSGVPFGAHAMMCAWLADVLAVQGIDCEFVWSDLPTQQPTASNSRQDAT